MTLQSALNTFGILKRGSSGNYVKLLQAMLCSAAQQFQYDIELGGGIDGVFGSYTELAVEVFQRDNALEYDGIVGSNTWNCLAAHTYPTTMSSSALGRWYSLGRNYAFSIQDGNSTANNVTATSEWYYYNAFSKDNVQAARFVHLGRLYPYSN